MLLLLTTANYYYTTIQGCLVLERIPVNCDQSFEHLWLPCINAAYCSAQCGTVNRMPEHVLQQAFAYAAATQYCDTLSSAANLPNAHRLPRS